MKGLLQIQAYRAPSLSVTDYINSSTVFIMRSHDQIDHLRVKMSEYCGWHVSPMLA